MYERKKLLARHGTTVRDAIYAVLDGLDVERYLRMGEVRKEDLEAVRMRLLG